jgi:hypothetical protein
MLKLCLNRDCVFAPQGIHIEHAGIVIHRFESIHIDQLNHPEFNWSLESLKRQRGNRCVQCTRYLIPTDKDYAFCNDCWNANLGVR